MNSLNLLQRVTILAVMISIILVHACTTDAHQSVRDFAISAICDFPPFSGNNMCRKADIIRFIEEDAASLTSTNDDDLKCWCVELEYIDYTGESGIASVWVIESSTKGDYSLYKGPLFDMQCERLH